MRSTFKILLYINRQKTKVEGKTAILCRITIDGKSTAITTAEECNPSEWNSKQGLTTDRKSNQRLHEFVEDKRLLDIPISTITEELFEEYRFFLKKRGLKGTTINNYLCWISRLMFRAVNQRIILCNPFEHTKYEKEEKKIRFLQKSDVAKLMSMTMNDREAEQARLMCTLSNKSAQLQM